MSNLYTIQKQTLTGIANAIREKNGSSNLYYPADLAAAIRGMETGGAAYNIAFGDTAPEDTSKLWIRCAEPEAVHVKTRFVAGEEELEFGVAGIPTAANGMAAATVGEKVYLFGGESVDGELSAIHMFDPETNTISTLSVTLPTPATAMAAVSVEGKIYLFGGYYSNTCLPDIYIFEPETESLTTLSARLPIGTGGMAAAAVGIKVYLFGGKGSETAGTYNNLNTICVFDTKTETITTLDTALAQAAFDIAAAAFGRKIYLFGGKYGLSSSKRLSTIQVFDTETLSISTLDTALPEIIHGIAPASVGQKIYLFGGNTQSTIQLFDAEAETISTLPTTLPTGCRYMGASAVGTVVYLFGGFVNDSTDLATVNKFVVSLPLTENHVLIDASGVQNLCYLLPTVELGVSNVYRGNAEEIAEKVPAALYRGGAWVEI